MTTDEAKRAHKDGLKIKTRNNLGQEIIGKIVSVDGCSPFNVVVCADEETMPFRTAPEEVFLYAPAS